MRKTLTSEMRRQRCQRRAVLAAMILATAAPSIAADSNSASLRIVSPLPLTAKAPANQVQDNPFCEPILAPLSNPMVKLASDSQVSSIRMKPIGVAVGLRSIGDPDAPLPPAILVTPPAESQIQFNPLIGSVHHDKAPESEVFVNEPASLDELAPKTSSVQAVTPPRPRILSIEPVIDSAVEVIEEAIEEPLEENALTAVATDHEPAHDEMVGQELVLQEAEFDTDEAESVMFSLTDSDPEEAASEDSDLGSIRPITIDDPASPPIANKPPISSIPIVAMAEPLVPIDFASEMLPSLKTAPGDVESNATVKKSGSGVVASLVSNANRYRPPVAVSTSSVPLIRNESTDGISLVRPAVTRVESLHLDDEEPAMAGMEFMHTESHVAQASAAIDLHMNKAQVRTLTIGGTFRRISLADQAICQAINSGSNELKLIGTGCGVTELTIWADTGNGQEPKVRVFRIHVQDAVDTKGDAVSDKAGTLNQSIARAFPNCRVQIRQENGQLVVAGDCDSDKSASGILRMIRKTCLIPVVDELRIR